MNLDAVRRRLRPSPEEEAQAQKDAADLVAAARTELEKAGLDGTPTVQGSFAKGTWIAGQADVDLFLLLPEGTPEPELHRAARAVGRALLERPQEKYAQHPYVVGAYRGRMVDVVPAYQVPEAEARMSAVDRTPFHTAWVKARLDDHLRDEVRLAKQWLKGVEAYGAETAIGGFSGYLTEVLVVHLDGFGALVDWLAGDARPRRIAAGDEQVDEVAPLVVVDPVDAARNCAAAVQEDTLARAVTAARAYQEDPTERFFFPAPPRPEPAQRLRQALREQEAVWIGLELVPQTDRLDLVLPQFQKAGRTVAAGLEEAGFPVHRWDVRPFDEERRVGLQWVVADLGLPATRTHCGPPADPGPHADRFRQKWQEHPDRTGEIIAEGGRLCVRLRVRERTPQAWIAAHGKRHLTGKHVQKALAQGAPLLGGPGLADEAWAPTVADVVLDRRPWER